MAEVAPQFNRRDDDAPWRPRRGDELAIGGLLAILLATIAVYWCYLGGPTGQLVEIDRQSPLTAEFIVDLNRADWPEIAQLPGVGETLARRIVELRAKDGPWKRVDDLRRVKGLGPKILEGLRPYVVVTSTAPDDRPASPDAR